MTFPIRALLPLVIVTTAALPNIAHAACGDGVIDSSEECDDLNSTNGDGCDSSCLIEDGYECVDASFALDFSEVLTTSDPTHSSPAWTLSSDGQTLTQSLNALPAVYVSTLPAVGVSMTFELTVNTTSDDDFIGWAIGYDAGENTSASADWLLFDWKQTDQNWEGNDGWAGLRMYRVTGAIEDSYEMWGHTDSVSEIAQAISLGSTGWADNTTYTVQVDYSTTQVDVYVDGSLEFSELGSWPTGNFGFYSLSQPSTEYTLTAPVDQSVCAEADSDGDGITDLVEDAIGTDRDDPDSDGDGVGDLDEVVDIDDPTDTDGDGTIDAIDSDDDGDGIDSVDEDLDGDGDPTTDDSDGDGTPDYLDDDDDDDGVPTTDEDYDGDGDPADNDADGDGDPDYLDTDSDNDGSGDAADCEPIDASINPSAIEYCDGVDNDCDGSVDEDDAIDASTWYADSDTDGYGDPGTTTISCTADSGWVADATDCDDSDPAVYPGADEYCNGIDDDCDGAIDEGSPVDVSTWYADTDGDGFGDAGSSQQACTQPSGYEANALDCDDADGAVFPGADEYCDAVDNDCDGRVDEGAVDATTWYADDDGDTYGDATDSVVDCTQPSSTVADDTDCDDGDSSVNPSADEYCNGIDDDCDGVVDEGAVDAITWYADMDGDGYGDPTTGVTSCDSPSGYVDVDLDCDDTDPDVYPNAPEVWYDGIDQNCDGRSDFDQDGDGYDHADYGGTDCDDTDETINPGVAEIWYDGVDQDCDGLSDYDRDGDGYDSESYGGDDCDDADADVYPGAPDEPYDGVITDCDNSSDYDADGDGHDAVDYGGDDCDDAASDVNPEQDEVWYDGVDQDCDGNDNDQDQDGFGVDEDCDDTDADVYPGAEGWSDDCEPISGDTADTDALPGDTDDTDGQKFQGGGGCGCSATPAAPSAALFLLAFIGLARRRQDGE